MNEDRLPFYRLSTDFEPMGCICDYGGPETEHWCTGCPYRAEHKDAAVRDLNERLAKEANT